jgi:membrane dipeptidase
MFTADAHCDTLYEIAVIQRGGLKVTPGSLAAGSVGMQVFAMFAGHERDGRNFARAMRMLAALREFPIPFLDRLPDAPPDKPHAVLSIEGGELIEGDIEKLAALDGLARLRMIALTWNFENEIGYPMVGGSTGGLKPFGFELLREMDGRGMLADVSHLNEAGFWDVVERAELPPVASHSNCRWLCDVPRNLKKEQARALIERGGFIGINFYSRFLAGDRDATLEDVVRHIDELMELGGEKAVGFGSDFDGMDTWPDGLGSPADFPNLLAALEKRGYTQSQIADIAGLNLWRVLKSAEATRRPPRTAS